MRTTIVTALASLILAGGAATAMACPQEDDPAPHAPVTVACWDEPNAAMPGGYERIGGDVSGMPKGSVLIALPYPNCAGGGHTWSDSEGAGFCPAGWSDIRCGA
jgi:hypothetical protein